jgi:hypothetical protein
VDVNLERLAPLLIQLSALMATLTIAAYVVGRVRRRIYEKGKMSTALFQNFREMHEQGELTDDEFRAIKARMASRLRAELNDTNEPG